MSTLLDIFASLPPEALVEGATVGVVTSDGREFVFTIGATIPAPPPLFEIPSPPKTLATK